jgi:translation initiation factor 2B subunit (eIF-2B alpha/beta/delta family)
MKNTSIKLNKILNDKIHGSSELSAMLNEYLFSIRNNPNQIKESIKLIQKKLGYFEVINYYLKELNRILRKKNKSDLINFLTSYSKKEDKKIESIFSKIYPVVKNIECVITLSRSKTVIDVLKLWYKKNKKLKVIICESRPKYEGRLMALDLVKAGINVELITDAMMGLYVPKIEAAVIGADSVLMNGNVINKVGSKSLALFCKEYKKSFYVVASGSKFSSKNIFNSKKENPKEVWDKQNNHLKVNNIYFEEIEKKFITKIFTD